MTDTASIVGRRQLGRLLRQLREQAGLSLLAAAQQLGFSRARMYRIENGQVPIREHDVIAMCTMYQASASKTEELIGLARAGAAKGWWRAYGNAVPAWFELYVDLEQAAARLRSFAPSVIPGLLQRREYAEWVFRRWIGRDDAAVDNAVAMRLERQTLLTRERPVEPTLDVIIDEGVLRRSIADPLGMHRQLTHLVDVASRPNVNVRVIPFAAGPHKAASCGQFTILEFPATGATSPEPTTIYCEGLTGALYLDKLADVKVYESVWAELEAVALDQHDSDNLIATIIEESHA